MQKIKQFLIRFPFIAFNINTLNMRRGWVNQTPRHIPLKKHFSLYIDLFSLYGSGYDNSCFKVIAFSTCQQDYHSSPSSPGSPCEPSSAPSGASPGSSASPLPSPPRLPQLPPPPEPVCSPLILLFLLFHSGNGRKTLASRRRL